MNTVDERTAAFLSLAGQITKILQSASQSLHDYQCRGSPLYQLSDAEAELLRNGDVQLRAGLNEIVTEEIRDGLVDTVSEATDLLLSWQDTASDTFCHIHPAVCAQSIKVALNYLLELSNFLSDGAAASTPLSKKARLIYEKLASLPAHKAMALPQIQDWFEREHLINLDTGTWKRLRKELLAYGLTNTPRIGYHVRH
jgi:hypothetical protein